MLTLIDLLNHHPQGAPLRVNEVAMTPAVARPVTDDDECFAHYGHRLDALDLALTYAYADRRMPFVNCAPMTVQVEELGSVTISGSRMRARNPLDPPGIKVEDGILTVSHLVFHRNHPKRWQAAVGMPVRSLAVRAGASAADADHLAVATVAAIVDHQRALLDRLQRSAELAARRKQAAAMLVEVAALQLDTLDDAQRPRA